MPESNPCLSHACSKCCYDTEMPLLESDVARLHAAGHSPGRFVERVEDAIQLRNVDGHCVFLVEGRCSVYDIRPEGCRLYPLVMIDGEPGLDDYCPYWGEFGDLLSRAPELIQIVDRLKSEASRRSSERTAR